MYIINAVLYVYIYIYIYIYSQGKVLSSLGAALARLAQALQKGRPRLR